MKVLINDGLHERGKWLLEQAGFEVDDHPIPQEELQTRLPDYAGIIIRSATRISAELIDACPNLRFVARGGVGLDNIDTDHARDKGIAVINTPAASSRSVAELVFTHILNIARGVNRANREMPSLGHVDFKQLKKSYSKGVELEGKSLGIIGLGRIGTETAKIALGMGMKVLPFDPAISRKEIELIINGNPVAIEIERVSMDVLLSQSDVITLHVPNQKTPIIGREEIERMTDGVILINASRGGIINEEALLEGLDSGKVLGAGLDVFENEPTPREELLNHPLVSLSPHIGASTLKAQEKIAVELAEKIMDLRDELDSRQLA